MTNPLPNRNQLNTLVTWHNIDLTHFTSCKICPHLDRCQRLLAFMKWSGIKGSFSCEPNPQKAT